MKIKGSKADRMRQEESEAKCLNLMHSVTDASLYPTLFNVHHGVSNAVFVRAVHT